MGGNEDEEIRFLSGVNWKDKMQQAEMKTHQLKYVVPSEHGKTGLLF